MAFGLLGCMVLCLLGAGECQDTWATWPQLAGLISSPFPEAAPFLAVSSSVSFPHRPLGGQSDPDPKIPHHKDGKTVDAALFSGSDHDAMYWYRQDPGLGPKLISLSRNVDLTEDGDVPEGYTVSRKEKKKFPLTVKSAGTNQTSLYLCASSVSTARLSQLLSAQKGYHKSEKSPSWGAPPQAGGKLPPPSVPLEALP